MVGSVGSHGADRQKAASVLRALPGAPTEYVAKALFNRGVRKGQLGDIDGEAADYATIIEMADAPKDQIARAHINRSIRLFDCGDLDGAKADSNAVLKLSDIPSDLVAFARAKLEEYSNA